MYFFLAYLERIFHFLVLVLFCWSSTVNAEQITTNNLIKNLDSNYYYPQKNGLISISAQVKWKKKDLASTSKTILKNLGFRFVAEFKGANSKKFLMIKEGGVVLSEDEKTQHNKLLNRYLDAFLPKTLHEKFSQYRGNVKVLDKERILLKFENNDSLDLAQDYELFVDVKKWRLSEIRIMQKHEPHVIKGDFRYARKNDKWIITETSTSFMIDGRNYSDVIEYNYKNFQSFWLVNIINQTIQQDGKNILLNRFRFVDYKINSKNKDYSRY